MKYPKLVRSAYTPIHVFIDSNDINEFGERETWLDKDLFCNYQSCTKQVVKSDRQYTELSGKAYFDGDICPDVPSISSGYAEIFGEKMQIHKGTKSRNPDGSVNYTLLELI